MDGVLQIVEVLILLNIENKYIPFLIMEEVTSLGKANSGKSEYLLFKRFSCAI